MRTKFIVGGLMILAAVIYLIVSATTANAQYFMTIEELTSPSADVQGRNLRASGAVIGDTINYDAQDLVLTFDVAHVPADQDEIDAEGGLATALHNAVVDPDRPRITVVYYGPPPDLLRDEAQAIMTGHLGDDGRFYADELLLKCPTKYEEAVPDQVEE